MLGTRILSATLALPFFLYLVYLGGWPHLGMVILLAFLGLREFFNLWGARGWRGYPWLAYGGAVLLSLDAFWFTPPRFSGVVLTLTLVLAVCLPVIRRRSPDPGEMAVTVAGLLYVGWFFSFLVALRQGDYPGGWAWELLALGITWSNDTVAYLVGMALGRHRLCPEVSPGKTVEGALAGLLAAGVTAMVMGSAALGRGNWWLLGLVGGVTAQAGDLLESGLKRMAGVKDSGSILPGHGGVLDRFDSLLLVAPLVYAYRLMSIIV